MNEQTDILTPVKDMPGVPEQISAKFREIEERLSLNERELIVFHGLIARLRIVSLLEYAANVHIRGKQASQFIEYAQDEISMLGSALTRCIDDQDRSRLIYEAASEVHDFSDQLAALYASPVRGMPG